MNVLRKYKVTSKTGQHGKGRPDLCWMNIDIDKLDRCCVDNEKYCFECEIGRGVHCFVADGKYLKKAFLDNDVDIMNRKGKGKSAYSFYLEYAKGEIYNKVYKSTGKFVCHLHPLKETDNE